MRLKGVENINLKKEIVQIKTLPDYRQSIRQGYDTYRGNFKLVHNIDGTKIKYYQKLFFNKLEELKR